MKTGLTDCLLKSNFKEFDILKGKKTGYYTNTSENRKKGRVGQKYSKEESGEKQEGAVSHKEIWDKYKYSLSDEIKGEDYIKASKTDSYFEKDTVWFKDVGVNPKNGHSKMYKKVDDPNKAIIAKKLAAIDKMTVKDIKNIEVEIDSVDEWVDFSIHIKGDWEAFENEEWRDSNSTKLREKLISLAMEHPKFKEVAEKAKNQSVFAEEFEDGPRVQKRVPIPTRVNDFDDFEIGNGTAWFSTSDR